MLPCELRGRWTSAWRLSFAQAGALERLAILHTGAEGRAREFLARIMQENSLMLPREILLVNVTPVIGAHVGPNALGVAAVRLAA